MIQGEVDSEGKLIFEIGLIDADGEVIIVKALLDTGFTDWLAINNQDAESLGWLLDSDPRRMQTAAGETPFNSYEGTVVLDGQSYTIPVLGGDELEEILLGVLWLQTKRLVVDLTKGVLTMGE